MNRPISHRAWTLVGVVSLVAVLLTVAAVALATDDGRPGRAKAIAVAAGICLSGSLGGWLAERGSPAVPARAVALGLAAVGLRLFPALVGLAWLRAAQEGTWRDDASSWLVIFYLSLLATDVVLHVFGPRKSG